MFPEDIIDQSSSGRVRCDICSISFIDLKEGGTDGLAIWNVAGLYKLHKSVDRLENYPLCLACFYALQNPATALDYPKKNRKNDKDVEYYLKSFQHLKRDSSFGYVSSDTGNVSYRVPDSALYDMEAASQYGDPYTLNMEDFTA